MDVVSMYLFLVGLSEIFCTGLNLERAFVCQNLACFFVFCQSRGVGALFRAKGDSSIVY